MSSDAPLLISLHVAGRPYLVRRDAVDVMALLDPLAPPATDARGRPLTVRPLAELLGAEEDPAPGRRHALSVALRRRSVALLVDRVDDMAHHISVQPLAPLLARRLARPWFLGAAAIDDAPVLLLDLRRIAADVALGII